MGSARRRCSTPCRRAATWWSATAPPTSPEVIEAQEIANQQGHPYNLRSIEQIAGYFEGLNLVQPGVVSIPFWRPEPGAVPQAVDGLLRRRVEALTT
ncbi:SAM-dependent methyltransferase [Micromonospora sp. CPCC 206061]|uniref:SAM-dependent methyltransferase n=1 Tax=Micromonospora sp. CPCC 206061 TaxID=3122410 RepID=UPI002FF146DA